MPTDFSLPITGVELIDNQHAHYVRLVKHLLTLFGRGDLDSASFRAEVQAVVAYAIEHFDAEEFLMTSSNYPAYQEHVEKHDKFRAWIDQFQEKISKETIDIADFQRLLQWLTDWFLQQVRVDDQKLANFLKQA
ncbi:MAG: hemerythrin family protein [Lentisphaeria bacterium]|nr:hemerythrin family protein [Lentisphaeria bacterium]